MRGRTLIAIAIVLSVLLSGCDRAKSERADAQTVLQKYAEALSAGDLDAAAQLTDQPQQAAADLTFSTESLGSPTLTLSKASISSSGLTEAAGSLLVTWDFGAGQTWQYPVQVELHTDEAKKWKIDWRPSVIHPDLRSDRRLSLETLSGPTPQVVDRHGQPVLAQQLVTVIRLDPTQITDVPGTAAALAAALAAAIPTLTADSIAAQLAANPSVFTLAALRPDVAATVVIPQLPGVLHNRQARLLSVDPGLRSPALRDLADFWKAQAQKASGWRIVLLDAQSEVIKELRKTDPSATGDLITTFDSTVQMAAQAAVDAIPGQAMIVAMTPSTGGILAVAQNAAADTEGPVALMGQYPPGSTFKIITTSAVLSGGIATPDAVFPCPAQASVKGRTIQNDEQFDLGDVPLHTAFAQSCNTTIAALATQLPYDALHAEALKFGVGVDYVTPGLTTITGSVPASESDAAQVEASIGQGKVLVSPFGMALAASTVVAGQTPVPTLIDSQPAAADQTPPAPSADSLAALRVMFLETVDSGTAKAAAAYADLGGKTGTAQYGDGSTSHGWFVGSYHDMAFAVLLVGAGSSGPAVNVAADFLAPIVGLLD